MQSKSQIPAVKDEKFSVSLLNLFDRPSVFLSDRSVTNQYAVICFLTVWPVLYTHEVCSSVLCTCYPMLLLTLCDENPEM